MKDIRPKKWFLLFCILALGGTLIYLQRHSFFKKSIEAKMRKEIAALVLKKLRPLVPFQIHFLSLEFELEDLKVGRIPKFESEIEYQGYSYRFQGSLKTGKNLLELKDPKVNFDLTGRLKGNEVAELPLNLLGRLSFSDNWKKIDEAEVSIEAKEFKFLKQDLVQAAAQKVSAHFDWGDENFSAIFALKEVQAADPKKPEARAGLFSDLRFEFFSPLKLSPLVLGPTVKSRLTVKGFEALYDEWYLSEEKTFEIVTIGDLEKKTQSIQIPGIGKGRLRLRDDQSIQHATFESSKLSLEKISLFLQALHPQFNFLKPLQLKRGELHASLSYPEGKNKLSISDFDLSLRREKTFLKKTTLKAEGMLQKNQSVDTIIFVEAESFSHRKIKGSLPLNTFHLQGTKENLKISSLGKRLKLNLQDFPLKIGKIEGTLVPFSLETSLKLDSTEVSRITNALCIKGNFPPAQVALSFTGAEITDDQVDVNGDVNVDLFGGKLKLKELGVFDLKSGVPEIDFSADWDGINLIKVGQWSHFEGINGIFKGYVDNAIFQGPLPTHYDLMLSLVPSSGKDIVFTPKGLKNFVRLFLGAEIDDMPSLPKFVAVFVDWLFFGWPSEAVGGYDVRYAGVKMSADNGFVKVETLDPKDLLEKDQKHFFLWGRRFKIGFDTKVYPAVLNQTTITNYIRGLVKRADQISKEEVKKAEDKKVLPAPTPTTAEKNLKNKVKDALETRREEFKKEALKIEEKKNDEDECILPEFL